LEKVFLHQLGAKNSGLQHSSSHVMSKSAVESLLATYLITTWQGSELAIVALKRNLALNYTAYRHNALIVMRHT